MAHKAVREFDGKRILCSLLPDYSDGKIRLDTRFLKISPESDLEQLSRDDRWVMNTKLVAKPDQLIKRRMQNGLVLLDASWPEVVAWVSERMNKEITVDGITGRLDTFIVEPFHPHDYESEYYLGFRSVREGDEILFFKQGGIDVGNVDDKANKITVRVLDDIRTIDLKTQLLENIRPERKELIAQFIRSVYQVYVAAGFAYLEINPAAYLDDEMIPLDIAARLDDTESFDMADIWGEIAFPAPFGRQSTPEEDYVRALDEKSGSSLKLTLLNPKGRVWALLAGGGASVVFTDTIADLGYGKELANYGEYSGNPRGEETYDYTLTILDLMTREKDPEGRDKVLLIGGGIANFTDVAQTFKGIGAALTQYQEGLKEVGARIYVRRGGPNYREGLENMRKLGEEIGIPIEVYGPETHMTRIVRLALEA